MAVAERLGFSSEEFLQEELSLKKSFTFNSYGTLQAGEQRSNCPPLRSVKASMGKALCGVLLGLGTLGSSCSSNSQFV
jgi:hypothetical protein